KAIDALDEACAHLQAEARYTPRTEEMIQRRIELLKQEAKAEQEKESGEKKPPADSDEGYGPFERIGAELEAFFVGTPAPVPNGAPKAAAPVQPDVPRPLTLAPLEADLTRALMEEGIVIRGHDVARVVGLMSGATVEWEANAPQ